MSMYQMSPQRLAVARARQTAAPSDVIFDVIDGYVWSTMPTQSADSNLAARDDWAPLGARWVILAAMQRHSSLLTQVETLDRPHAIAVKHSVVTPYSSMIVLVNAG